MLISALLTAALWPSAVIKDCAPSADVIMVGVAKNDAGNILYCELVSQTDEQTLKVSYFSETKLFAEKTLQFSISPFIPSVMQKDFRVGELRQAVVSAQSVELHYQANSHKKTEKSIIPMQKVDILDAGFDNFIRKNWDELQSGSTLSVNFASMPHLKTLPLRISKQSLEKCSPKNDDNSPKTCFFVEVDNALLRMLLGNIKITYDQHHRLYEFNGTVNVQDNDQDNQKAIIRYYYAMDYPTPSQ